MFTKAPELAHDNRLKTPENLSPNIENTTIASKTHTDDILTMSELLQQISLLERGLVAGKEIKNLERDNNYAKENGGEVTFTFEVEGKKYSIFLYAEIEAETDVEQSHQKGHQVLKATGAYGYIKIGSNQYELDGDSVILKSVFDHSKATGYAENLFVHMQTNRSTIVTSVRNAS